MKTILGPFHPHLERALVDELHRYKADHPLLPVLILVPSDALRRRLKMLLTREQSLSWVNLQLLTFHQLSLRLFSEANGMNAPMFRDDLFFEEVLRQMIRTKQPGTEPFAGIEERASGCAALWQTLRDLRDGMVEPSVVLEALGEDNRPARMSEKTSHLLALLETMLLFCREKGIEDYSDLDQWATTRIQSSSFLRHFGQIFYYGFYDLTQVQVDFFHCVVQNYPTTLFFPLLQTQSSHAGWGFAERFYQRYVRGRTGTSAVSNLADAPDAPNHLPSALRLFDQTGERSYGSLPKEWRCQIINAFGIDDEITAVAKEILRLVADDGITFNEIGVVARSLDAYGLPIKEIFHRHHIPLTGVIEEPLVEFPLTKAVILLLNLPAKDYLRTHVIDLVSSPYFQFEPPGWEKIPPRPDMWDLATRELAICKGIQEWRRLESYAARDLILWQVSDDDEPRVIKIAAAQIRCLASIFKELSSDLETLPPEAPWSHYAGACKQLLKKYLSISSDSEMKTEDSEALVGAEILTVLERLAGLDVVQANVALSNFSQTLQHWLERSTVATPPLNAAGVTVLNAMAARGHPFRALFIVGLNEGVFPRTIREDAFLRDRDREILERDLGFKVNPKLAGFDEEKLVFTLLVNAARERLYCLYQRADESGRVLAPSWYLTELRRVLEGHAEEHLQESTIPRGIVDKIGTSPFDRDDLLLPEELAVRLSLQNQDPTPLIEAFDLSPSLYKQGRQVVGRLDLTSAGLDAFDGVVGLLPDYWRHFSERGLSPTALETYGRCPFQFFARHVLGLERLERPEEITGPSAAEFGELGHLILKSIYQELICQDYFTGTPATAATAVESTLSAVAQRAFADYASKNPIGYPLAWEILQESLTEVLRQVLARDLEEISMSGYTPFGFEIDAKEQLGTAWPEPLTGQTIRGRMDRIDRDRTRNRLRVIDYKFKSGLTSTVQDRDLYRAALRGEKLQPPFYFLLGKRLAEADNIQGFAPEVEAAFYYIAPRWSDGPLVTATFRSDGFDGQLGNELRRTIAYLARGVQQGRFFISPGDYCRRCDVAEICRKNHPPSLWRAENDPLTLPHRQLHEKDPKKL